MSLSEAARREWAAAARCMAEKPFPADLLEAREEIVRAGLARRVPHDLWVEALTIKAGERDVPGDDAIRGFVRRACDGYAGYFVWPPTKMLQNARFWEPHLDRLVAVARDLGLWREASRFLHARALLVAWTTESYERPLEYAGEAVACLRRDGEGRADAGTLALALSGLATWQHALGRHGEARRSLEEAVTLLSPLVAGKRSIEMFLLQCALGAACEKAGDAAAAARAREEARAMAKLMENPGLEKHVGGTLSWAQWQLQRYIGL